MQLALGPVMFNWDAETWRDFYFRIAEEAPVEVVYLGEVVCSKRSPFFAPHLAAIVERLQAAGKEVVFSSLALVTLGRERQQLARLAGDVDRLVEANDMTAVRALSGRSHVIGPLVNVYNEVTAAYLERNGARRICLPPELPATSIARIAMAVEAQIEVFAFGRAPLAISARCYHARLHELTKDNCRFVCDRDPDGLSIDTLDGQGFLAVNGVQTLSHTCINLAAEATDLARMGVAALRLSPQACDMVAVSRLFRDVVDGRLDAESGLAAMASLYSVPFSNGFVHGAPGAAMVRKSATG